MRIRIRFTKRGPIRYVGHLDFMRCFQKGIKKSGLPALYSAGFSPHMLMSFAAPLAIGEETEGDYVDVDFAWKDPENLSEQELYRLSDMGLDNGKLPPPPPSAEFCRILDAAMPEGVAVTDASRVGLIKGSKAMALVRYAAYELYLPDPSGSCRDGAIDESEQHFDAEYFRKSAEEWMAQPSVVVHKKSKKSERDVDIRPLILRFGLKKEGSDEAEAAGGEQMRDSDGMLCYELICASGSMQNLKPQMVMEVFAEAAGFTYDPYDLGILRKELYDEEMRPLLELGTDF